MPDIWAWIVPDFEYLRLTKEPSEKKMQKAGVIWDQDFLSKAYTVATYFQVKKGFIIVISTLQRDIVDCLKHEIEHIAKNPKEE